jgi:ribosomal protein S18 acetylase RimI-like enzyme
MYEFHALRKATPDDIFFIRALEMDPANLYVHSWDFATHEARINDPKFHYLIAEDAGGKPLGYAILLDNEPGRVEWRRIIVARRGDGIGKAFMQAVLEYFFTTQNAECVWLDVYEQNDRARHVYERLGFKETGEDLAKVPGERLVIMERYPPL